MKLRSTIRNGITGLILTAFNLHPVWADDTEIFFNSLSNSATQPNLLFVLDASQSMRRFDCYNADGTTTSQTSNCNDGTPSGTTSRLDRMNAALKEVLDVSSGVNVGLMRFAGTRGGRVIFPMTDIDAEICSTAECLRNHVFKAQAAVNLPEDDAVEDSDGNVVTIGSIVPLMDGDNSNVSALRFTNLRIPQGAIIESAKMQFYSATDSTESNLTFSVENVADAAPFSDGSQQTISNRQWAPLQASWNTVTPWVQGNSYETPDLSNLVSQIVNRTDWCGGNALAVKIEGSGDRSASSFDQDTVNRIALKVEYKLSENPDSSNCILHTVHSQISDPADDTFEWVSGNNTDTVDNNNTGSYLIPARFHAYQFKDLEIPKGAQVREAYLRLFADNNRTAPVVDIGIETTANPEEFTLENKNISNRSWSTLERWTVSDFANDVWLRSPDISGAVRDIVALPDWASGNSMSFSIQSVSGPDGIFATRNKNSELAPRLVVRYEANGASVVDAVNSVRTELALALDDIKLSWGTATVGAIEEAMRYYAGDAVHFGKNRAMHYTPSNRSIDILNSRVSHPDSYSGGAISREPACTEDNLDDPSCLSEQITGNPVYTSPIQQECQSNHVIVLSDGGPFVGNSEDTPFNDRTNIIDRTESLAGVTCSHAVPHGVCGEELAEYMNRDNIDINTSVTGAQNITTHYRV